MNEEIMLAVEIYHDLADKANDSYDHDELHSAGAVLAMLNGAVPTEKDIDYVTRWMRGLYERETGKSLGDIPQDSDTI